MFFTTSLPPMNVTCALATIMLVGLAGPAHAQDQKSWWGSPNDPVVNYMISVAEMWSDSNCRPPQAALLDALAEDFQGTSTRGERYDKANAAGSGKNRECQLLPVRVRFFGDSLAIAYGGESRITRDGGGVEFKRCQVWTDVWIRRDDRWQVIAAQDTVVACDASEREPAD
jgi:hypothetical protein